MDTLKLKLLLAFLLLTVVVVDGFSTTCTPSFEYRDGWLGGDGIYSVELSNNKTAWIFGDSFVNAAKSTSRHDSDFVANSIGISECVNGKFNIRYYWDTFNFSIPKGERDYKLWPKDTFVSNGKLYIVFDKVGFVDDFGKGGLGFEIIGTTLVTVSNPLDVPTKWNVQFKNILNSKIAHTGVSIVKKDGYAFMLTILGNDGEGHYPQYDGRPMALQRIALDSLESIDTKIEYLAKDGTWKRGNNFEDFKIVIDRGATELSIRFHEKTKRWVIISLEAVWFSNVITMRTSSQIEGPWGPETAIASIPEMTPGHPSYSKDVFCYAVKEQIQFYDYTDNSMVITYACNSLNPDDVMNDNTIYRPIAVRVIE